MEILLNSEICLILLTGKKSLRTKMLMKCGQISYILLKKLQDRCVPRKLIRNTKTRKPLWWKSSITKALKIKKRAFKKYISTGNE